MAMKSHGDWKILFQSMQSCKPACRVMAAIFSRGPI